MTEKKLPPKYLIWSRGMRGKGVAALSTLNPAQSMDWKVIEQRTVCVITLPEKEHELSLDQITSLYPCPSYEVGA